MQKKYLPFTFLSIFVILLIISFIIFKKTPYDFIIPNDYNQWSIIFDKVIYQIKLDDRIILKNYLDRHNPEINKSIYIEAIPININIQTAINIEKKYQQSTQYVKDEIWSHKMKLYEDSKNLIANTLFVTYLNKSINSQDFNLIDITYAIKNKSNINIIEFSGNMRFIDSNQNILSTTNILKQNIFPANETTTITETYKKEELENFELIKNIDSEKLDCKIVITSIILQNNKNILLEPMPN